MHHFNPARTAALVSAVSAALVSLSGTAAAASVTLYGTVDTGFSYLGVKETGAARDNSFSMGSGLSTDSRIGLKGTEELGNGLSVGFVLENTFNSDSGELGAEGTLFDKEAAVSLSGGFGTVSLGRMGALTSGSGTYNIFTANADAMDGGYADAVGTGYWLARDVYNNMLTYATPDFGGLTIYAQYSFGTETDAPHSRSKDRYAAVGAVYANGPFATTFTVDSVLKSRQLGGVYVKDVDDAVAVSWGANFDLEFMKPFVGVQYGKHESRFAGYVNEDANGNALTGDYDGFAIHVGSAFPAFGGELQVSGYYAEGDGYDYNVEGVKSSAKRDVSMWGVAVMHAYELSSRTSLYLGAGYQEAENQLTGEAKAKTKTAQALAGIAHNF